MSYTVISIAARMGSTRLPGKVMAPILGQPMLAFQIQRLRCVRAEIAVATTIQPEDDVLADLARKLEVRCVRGPVDDLMARHARVVFETEPDLLLLVGADDPLLEPTLLEALIARWAEGDTSYVKSAGWPLGMNSWGFSAAGLIIGNATAFDADEREHVVPFFERRPDSYRMKVLQRAGPDLYHRYRLTVDTPADLEVVRRVAEALWWDNPQFGWSEIEPLFEQHPDWAALNRDVSQYFYDLTPLE